jgi:type 1 fimbria pilin
MTTLALSGTAAGSNYDVNVNFTAYLTETTCDMKLVGGTGSDTKQTLKIGDSNGEVRLESVVAGTATAKFKIAIVECPASLQSLKTTVKGTPASAMLTGLVNQITVANGGLTGLQSRLHVNLNLRRLLKSTQPPTPSVLSGLLPKLQTKKSR